MFAKACIYSFLSIATPSAFDASYGAYMNIYAAIIICSIFRMTLKAPAGPFSS